MTRFTAVQLVRLPSLVILILLLPLIFTSSLDRSLLVLVVIYGTLGLSYNLTLGRLGEFSLAHGALFGIGAYAAALSARDWSVPFELSLLIAGLAGAVAAAVLGLVAFRLTGAFFAILTLAFAEVVTRTATVWTDFTGGSIGVTGIRAPDPWFAPGVDFRDQLALYLLVSVVATIVVYVAWAIANSRAGRATVAVREAASLARSIGVSNYWQKVITFTMSGTAAAIAGGLAAYHLRVVTPELTGFKYLIIGQIASIVGGRKTLAGPFLGAAFYVWMPEFVRVSEGENQLFFAVILFLTVMLLPQGLWPAVGIGAKFVANIPASLPALLPWKTAANETLDHRQAADAVPAGGPASRPVDAPVGDGCIGDRNADSRKPGEVVMRCEDVSVRFGGLQALESVSLSLGAGEILGVIGPNGAGKTTLFNVISGYCIPQEGQVYLGDERITRRVPERIARMGLVRTFQHVSCFPGLSTRENMYTGQHRRFKANLIDAVLRSPRHRREERQIARNADEALNRFGLSLAADQIAVDLPHGALRRLGIATAVVGGPKVLLLDEPATGMNEEEVLNLQRLIEDLRGRQGLSVIVVEHNVGLVMRVCDRIVVLDQGRKIAEGTPEDIANDETVIEAYLGIPEPIG